MAQEDIFEEREDPTPPSKRRPVHPGAPEPGASDAPAMEAPPVVGEEGDEGFVMDDDSGLLYNSARGLFFDPASQRFRDANTGQWFAAG